MSASTSTESTSRGHFVWYDLMTTDPDAAEPFYAGLLGWGTEHFDGAGKPYTMWTSNGTPLGGRMPLPPEALAQGAPPHWLPYVSTPDVHATAARAGELGAKVLLPPTDIPTVGCFAILADPAGAVFAAYTSATPTPEPEGPPKVGQFSWHELAADDHATALSFYSDLFGWQQIEAHDMGEMGPYVIYGNPGIPFPFGGIFNKPPGMPASWILYLRVDDIDQAVTKVRDLGGEVVNGPMEVPGGDRIAQCKDPQGAFFALHAVKSGG